jgi:hypothetical protein
MSFSKFERQVADQLASAHESPALEFHPRLRAVSNMLKRVIEKAKTVQKGTDSQKKFSLQYAELCQTVVVGLRDVEASARAGFASVGSSNSTLSPVGFLAAIAAAVSAGSGGVLGAAYLESIGRSANHKVVAAAAKAEDKGPPPLGGSRAKRSREADAPSPTAPHHIKKLSPKAVPSPVIVGVASPLLHSQHPMHHDPLPAFSLADGAALPGGKGRPQLAPDGKLLSSKRLSSRPGLAVVMMPWTMPPPYSHGVAIERAVIERATTGSGSAAVTQLLQQRSQKSISSPVPGAEIHGSEAEKTSGAHCRVAGVPKVLEICQATSGSEMLHLWEIWDAALDHSLAKPVSVASGKSAAAGVSPALAPQPASPALGERLPFFPHRTTTTANDTVPASIVSAMFHFGVVATEAPYFNKT